MGVVIIKTYGGLGNQMFQFAMAKSYSKLHSKFLFVDNSWFYKKHTNTPREYLLHKTFDIRSPILPLLISKFIHKVTTNNTYNRISPFYHIKENKSSYYRYDKINLYPRRHAVIDGYWQSYKYFHEQQSLISSEFKIKDNIISQRAKYILNKINNSNSVSMHIRRGDYESDYTARQHHGLTSLQYYRDALELISNQYNSNFRLFIFSDDTRWAIKNMASSKNQIIVEGFSDIEDFYLMTQCKHNIIANSTFSWWAAYLNRYERKSVIVPKIWCQDIHSNMTDLFPSNWHLI